LRFKQIETSSDLDIINSNLALLNPFQKGTISYKLNLVKERTDSEETRIKEKSEIIDSVQIDNIEHRKLEKNEHKNWEQIKYFLDELISEKTREEIFLK
jgi:hypothetical protein